MTTTILSTLAARYIAGESLRTLTLAAGYRDWRHFATKLRPAVESLGGHWRTAGEAQQYRRNGEREGVRPGELSKAEAMELNDPIRSVAR